MCAATISSDWRPDSLVRRKSGPDTTAQHPGTPQHHHSSRVLVEQVDVRPSLHGIGGLVQVLVNGHSHRLAIKPPPGIEQNRPVHTITSANEDRVRPGKRSRVPSVHATLTVVPDIPSGRIVVGLRFALFVQAQRSFRAAKHGGDAGWLQDFTLCRRIEGSGKAEQVNR
jgi:hypothetical protein